MDDLAPDPVLRRNIQRIQAAETARNNIDEDDDDIGVASRSSEKRAQSVRSNYAPRQSLAQQVKAEGATASARASMVPNSQPVRAAVAVSRSRSEGQFEEDDEQSMQSTAHIVDLGVGSSDDDDDS